jgi:hypothetical protein
MILVYYSLFPEEPEIFDLLSAFTALSRLEGPLEKRKRTYTIKYNAAVTQGDIKGSQPGRTGRP